MKHKRLVCVVEGRGEVRALPNLCWRIRNYLRAWRWIVDENPVHHPRSRLVDQRQPSPMREAAKDGIERAVRLALKRPAAGVLVVCDADDDCAGVWGPSASAIINTLTVGDAVMIEREYETWLLHSFSDQERRRAGIRSFAKTRDAKGLMKSLVPHYKPTTHQLAITRKIDIESLWAASDSFDKLMRSMAAIFEVKLRERP